MRKEFEVVTVEDADVLDGVVAEEVEAFVVAAELVVTVEDADVPDGVVEDEVEVRGYGRPFCSPLVEPGLPGYPILSSCCVSYLSNTTNPACSKWVSLVRASRRRRSFMTRKLRQSVKDQC